MELRKYLKDEKYSLDDFAKIVGCTQPHISLICSKKRRPSPDLALKIEEITAGEVTLIELLYPDREKAA